MNLFRSRAPKLLSRRPSALFITQTSANRQSTLADTQDTRTQGAQPPGLTRPLIRLTCSYLFFNLNFENDILCSKRVFILGPSHHFYLDGCAISSCEEYDTPVGALPLDLESAFSPYANCSGETDMWDC